MKNKYLLICLMFFLVSQLFSQNITTHVSTELAGYSLNDDSFLNPDNMYGLNEMSSYINGNVNIKTDPFDPARVFFSFDCRYDPIELNPATSESNTFMIKELSIDLQTDLFSAKVGKQFLSWGTAKVFNPIDIINNGSNIFSEEEEGTYSIDVLIPFKNWLSLECVTYIFEDEIQSLPELPVIAKLGFSFWNFTGFTFGCFQKDKKNRIGVNLDFSFVPCNNMNITLFGQGLYRGESDITYFSSSNSTTASVRSDAFYGAMVAGLSLEYTFDNFFAFDGINISSEFSYDMENWTETELSNYWDVLDSVKLDLTTHSSALSYYNYLKNSPMYLYSEIEFSSVFIQDLQLSTGYLINLSDYSFVLLPELTYIFNNENTQLGVRGRLFEGGSQTEFGNNLYKGMVSCFLKTSF